MLRWLGDGDCHEVRLFGGKAANLSRLAAEYRIPPGFAVSAEATFGIANGAVPPPLAASITEAYEKLCTQAGDGMAPVAVRSSAIDEDGAEASFAGQHETYLNVRGGDAVVEAFLKCVASAQRSEALAYRRQHGMPVDQISIAVLIQSLVAADSAAVVFSANPITGNRNEVVVNASWGLGESIVGGTVTPDTFVVDRGSWDVISRGVARKTAMTVRTDTGTREVPVPRFLQDEPSLRDEQVVEMARVAARLEEQMGWPADMECAVTGDELYLLQCRPITQLGRM